MTYTLVLYFMFSSGFYIRSEIPLDDHALCRRLEYIINQNESPHYAICKMEVK